MSTNTFDASFYRRFYTDPRTRVTTPAEMERRAEAISSFVKHLELPVKNILDAGCGMGWMRPALEHAFPKARYFGLEVSEHLCERFGWIRGSLSDYRPRARFDLIICYDVMQYLSDREAVRAMANLGRLCRGALYFHAPTLEDWRRNADRSCSDGNVHLRGADWYRSRLRRQFKPVGFGLHVRRGVWYSQWELEK